MAKEEGMALVRWSPLNRMLSQWPDLWDEDVLPVMGSVNSLDVYETNDEVVVRANVAGVKDKDIDITFEKGSLWIKAERVEEEDKKDKKHYSKSSWSYSYKVAVPGLIDHGHEPDVVVEDGVLTITFKKSEASKPRKLAVRRK